MKAIHRMVAVMAVVSGLSVHAMAATSDPEVVLYRFPGVRNEGFTDNIGVATLFHCTVYSGTQESLRFVLRDAAGALVDNVQVNVSHLASVTASTHGTLAYGTELRLSTATVSGGTTAIAATSTNVICTAMVIDASTVAPVGVALRGVRFSPAPGTQE
jgi:hypothetical protein